MIRLASASRVLLLPRGRFSSMLDMGGVPEAGTAKRVDLGRNNKVKAVALDFNLITRSIEAQKARGEADAKKQQVSASGGGGSSAGIGHSTTVQPNTGMVENIANLLNVKLGGETGRKKAEVDDNISGLTGEASIGAAQTDEIGSSILGVLSKKPSSPSSRREEENVRPKAAESRSKADRTKAKPFLDARSKYADKLRKKLDGGLAGVERANVERAEALQRGDAAGHLTARKIAASQAVLSGSKWLATTGAATLLQYLTSRSVRVALLPVPNNGDTGSTEAEGERMETLVRQLPQARFDVLLKDGSTSADSILSRAEEELDDVPALETLVVSDREDYLRSAKEAGMFTCRVRPLNAPRGNVSTSYTVSSVAEVEEALDELNGISYNTVFSNAGINHGGV